MNKCVTLADIDQNLSCSEQDNMGGIVPSLIFGYWDDVKAWPDFPAVAEAAVPTLEEAGALKGDVVMATGAKAYKFTFTDDAGEFKISPQGEQDGESYLYELSIVSARIRKQIFGFMNATKGRKMFFIVQDNNGEYYLMGDKRRGAKMSTGDGAATGTSATARNQTTMKFHYTCPRALVYEGDVANILTAATGA
jgi:hypothetical protein